MSTSNIYFSCCMYLLQSTLIKSSSNVTFENSLTISRNEDDLTVVTESILNNCFKNDNLFLTLGSDDVTDILKAYSKSLRLFDINNEIFIHYKRFRKVYILEELHVRSKIYPSLGVVIDILPDMNLKNILEDMRNSIWWNSQSLFLLVNRKPQDNCGALDYLKILWDFKILSAVHVCRETPNQVSLYTFNPFTNSAPKHWQKVQIINDHWTLFKLRFQRPSISPELCNSLYFDKGKHLNGYRLKVQMYTSIMTLYDAKKDGFDRIQGSVPSTALANMNATLDLKLSPNKAVADENGNPLGALRDVHYDKVDVTLNWYYLRSFWKQMSYPFDSSTVYILTLKTPIDFESTFSLLFKWNFWLVFTSACTICILILKYVLRDTTSFAVMKFVQVALSSAEIEVPPHFFTRMLLFIVVIVISATNSFMQIHLNWWCTLPKYESSMQTIEDIIESNITIYGLHSYKDLIWQERVTKNIIGVNSLSDCLNNLNDGKQVACIVPGVLLIFHSWWKNPLIYKLKRRLFEKGASCFYAEDFPLGDRLNMVMQRMKEGGLININSKGILHPKLYNTKESTLGFEILSLSNLIICLYILIVGWASAVLAFIVELLNPTIK